MRRSSPTVRKIRVAYVLTHPIQYQAPLLRKLAQHSAIDLTVFYRSDFSVGEFTDPGFGTAVRWDVGLLDGYRYELLPKLGNGNRISFWRPLNYGLARRLRKGRFDALWIHGYAHWFHLMAMQTARRLGIKVLLRDEATPISIPRGPAKLAGKRMLFAGIRNWCDGFLAIGSLNREYYLSYGIEAGRIFLMPYAVDNSFFRTQALIARRKREVLRASLELERGRPVILFAGKMTERKRAGDLLDAYVRLSPDGQTEPRPYLLLSGDGEKRPELEGRVKKLGWKSVKFLGFKNQTELPRFYDLCDVFVLPSVREPWGLVVNEAMNAGRAIIVSDQVGCAPDLVRHGENGFVFRSGDVCGLSKALGVTLGDRARCREMGRRSSEIVNGWSYEGDVAGLELALTSLDGRGLRVRNDRAC